MADLPPFHRFPEITRLYQDCVITEKLDGASVVIHVSESGVLTPGSREKWITTDDDLYGFAAWVETRQDDLRQLGPGYHRGEWWGKGIGRGYNLEHREFSLFNTSRWGKNRPGCCSVVPVLYEGHFCMDSMDDCLRYLKISSRVVPGYGYAEGIVIYLKASQTFFKHTLNGNRHKRDQ